MVVTPAEMLVHSALKVPSFLTLEIRRLKGFLVLSLSMPGGALYHWLPMTILSSRLAAPGSPRIELCVLANGIKQWLLHHLHVHSRDARDIRRTLNSTPGSSRPHTMHISWYNTGIPRMWTDFGKPFVMAAMLVSQTSPLGVELFCYANAFFCSNKFA